MPPEVTRRHFMFQTLGVSGGPQGDRIIPKGTTIPVAQPMLSCSQEDPSAEEHAHG